jgi:putative endonuclease
MHNKKIGKIGEDLSCNFLIKNGFEIIERNYQKRIGEIDIIAFKKGILHFFEVKTVSRETLYNQNTYKHSPEENVTREKVNKIEKTAELFLLERGFKDEFIQIDLLTVYLTKGNCMIDYFPNINFN